MPAHQSPHQPDQTKRHRKRQPRAKMSPGPRPARALHPAQLVAEAQPERRVLHHQPNHIRRKLHLRALVRQPVPQHKIVGVKLAEFVEPANILKTLSPHGHGRAQGKFCAFEHRRDQHTRTHLHTLTHRVQLRRKPTLRRPDIHAPPQPHSRVLQHLHHAAEVVLLHPHVGIAGHVEVILRHRVHLRERIHLRIVKLRPRLTARNVPRLYMRIPRPYPPCQYQTFVGLLPRTKQQFVRRRIILLEKRLQVPLHPQLGPVERLQHTHRRQEILRAALFTPTPQPETHRRDDHHAAVDRRRPRPDRRHPEQTLNHKPHRTNRKKSRTSAHSPPLQVYVSRAATPRALY